jgi:hypothetical protein
MTESRVSISLDEIDRQIATLRAKAKSLLDEADRLEALKLLALEVGEVVETINPTVTYGKPGDFTADRVERILRQHGALHVEQIVPLLKASGWPGSGDDRKDYKNIFSNLSTKPDRFRRVDKGTFDLATEKKT